MKYLILMLSICLCGCTQSKATHTIESTKANWHYIKSTDQGYHERTYGISGNCVDYAFECRRDLLCKGVGIERMKIWYCMIPEGPHSALIIDDKYVLDINYDLVMRKYEIENVWIAPMDI